MAILAPSADAASLFAPRVDWSVGSPPFSVYSVATADFNEDGHPDLATADFYGPTVSVLLGTGSGSFGTGTSFSAANGPNQVISADFDGDGHADLATANYQANSVSLFRGTGHGTFAAHSDFAAGINPASLASADFDGDGDLDLAVVGYKLTPPTNPHLSILLNNGAGSFAAPVDYSTAQDPQYVTSADFNGDGHPDLAVANFDSNSVSVRLNTGTGSFAAKVDYPVGTSPGSLTTADFDGDGSLDIASANYSSDNLSVLLGNGDGTFAAKTDYGTGTTPSGVAGGDFNDDGFMDLISANFNSKDASVLLGNGDGTFAAKQDFATAPGAYSAAPADFDGDGRLDVAVATLNNSVISVLLGSGAPTVVPDQGSLAFGQRSVGTASPSQAVEITNEGNARLRVGSVQLVGVDPSEFEIRADGCSGQALHVGESCAVSVRFAPDGTGAKQAALRFTDNAPDSPQVVTLTGTGVPAPDVTPPDVFFTSGPAGLTNDRTPTFGFAMSEVGTFECRVDGAQYTACISPTTLATLADGSHTFEVRGTETAGNRSTVARTLLIDATPPETTLREVPGKVVVSKKGKRATMSFRFTASEANATFACSIDGGDFAPCESPTSATFGVGLHTFAVRATDLAGNVDPSPATASFKVKVLKKHHKSKH